MCRFVENTEEEDFRLVSESCNDNWIPINLERELSSTFISTVEDDIYEDFDTAERHDDDGLSVLEMPENAANNNAMVDVGINNTLLQ